MAMGARYTDDRQLENWAVTRSFPKKVELPFPKLRLIVSGLMRLISVESVGQCLRFRSWSAPASAICEKRAAGRLRNSLKRQRSTTRTLAAWNVATGLKKPVLALAYHGKSQDLMALLGQGKFALDAAGWEPHRLVDLVFEIERERDQITEQIASRLPAIRRTLEDQYDAVLGRNFSRRESVTTEQFEVQSGTGWN